MRQTNYAGTVDEDSRLKNIVDVNCRRNRPSHLRHGGNLNISFVTSLEDRKSISDIGQYYGFAINELEADYVSLFECC